MRHARFSACEQKYRNTIGGSACFYILFRKFQSYFQTAFPSFQSCSAGCFVTVDLVKSIFSMISTVVVFFCVCSRPLEYTLRMLESSMEHIFQCLHMRSELLP